MIYRKLHPCNNVVLQRCLLDLQDENVVVSVHARAAELPVYERLNASIHCLRDGAETFALERRRLRVDDDSYLLLNAGRAYGSRIAAGARPLHTFSVHFRRGLAAEVVAAAAGHEAALDSPEAARRPAIEFLEHLTPHNPAVSPALRQLMRDVDEGEGDREWLEERCGALLAGILRWHHGVGVTLHNWAAVRAPVRREIECRIGRATDLILTEYAQPLTLLRMANEACMSRYHFVRLFRAVHRMPPYAFLQRKRSAVAARLLTTTDLPLEAIAHAVGIGNRITFFRLIRKHHRVSPSELRMPGRAHPVLALADSA